MTRTLIVIAAFTLSVPAALVPPADSGKPESPGTVRRLPASSGEERGQEVQGHAEEQRGELRDAVRTKPNAHGKCVSGRKLETETDAAASRREENAAKACKKERDQLGATEFKRSTRPDHPNGRTPTASASPSSPRRSSRRELIDKSATGRRHRLRR